MKIFLSWSKPRSRAVAEALNDWLKRVIQAVKPFYSPEIEKGANWSKELDTALEGTRFGIICLTPDNLNSTWIHYEAGALSKTPDALIWTFLHGINHGNVPQPLAKFQHTVAEKDDVFKLLKSVNKRLADVGGEPLDIEVLSESFERYWPSLEEKLKAAESVGNAIETPREDKEILLEILEIVRNQQRAVIGNLPITVNRLSPISLLDIWPAKGTGIGTRYRVTVLGESLSKEVLQLIKKKMNAIYDDIEMSVSSADGTTTIDLDLPEPLNDRSRMLIQEIFRTIRNTSGIDIKNMSITSRP